MAIEKIKIEKLIAEKFPNSDIIIEDYWNDMALVDVEYFIFQDFLDNSTFIHHRFNLNGNTSLFCEPRNQTGLSSCPMSASYADFICDGDEYFDTYLKVPW